MTTTWPNGRDIREPFSYRSNLPLSRHFRVTEAPPSQRLTLTGVATPPIDDPHETGRTSVYDPSPPSRIEGLAAFKAAGKVWRLEPMLHSQEGEPIIFDVAHGDPNGEYWEMPYIIIRGTGILTGELAREDGTRGNVKASNGQRERLFHPFTRPATETLPVPMGRGRTPAYGHGDKPWPVTDEDLT